MKAAEHLVADVNAWLDNLENAAESSRDRVQKAKSEVATTIAKARNDGILRQTSIEQEIQRIQEDVREHERRETATYREARKATFKWRVELARYTQDVGCRDSYLYSYHRDQVDRLRRLAETLNAEAAKDRGRSRIWSEPKVLQLPLEKPWLSAAADDERLKGHAARLHLVAEFERAYLSWARKCLPTWGGMGPSALAIPAAEVRTSTAETAAKHATEAVERQELDNSVGWRSLEQSRSAARASTAEAVRVAESSARTTVRNAQASADAAANLTQQTRAGVVAELRELTSLLASIPPAIDRIIPFAQAGYIEWVRLS